MRDQETKSSTLSLNKESEREKTQNTKDKQPQLISKGINSEELCHSALFSYLRIYSLETHPDEGNGSC